MSLYDDASLIMYPSGYKEDKIYSLKPTDGSGDLTFTRASTATRVNAEGLIETSPVNLLQNSEDLSNAYWQKNNVAISSNTTVAPNGTTTADTLTNSSTGYGIFATLDVIPNQQYTFSFYIKKGTNTSYLLSVIDSSIFTSIASLDYSSQVSATDWIRITQTFTIPLGTTSIRVYQMRDGASIGTAFLWGAQLNIGATAKPYFPTTDRLNVPRIDYTGGGCGSLLLEKQSTNLITYSEQFDNAAWFKENVAITPNAIASPSGLIDADMLVENSSNAFHAFRNTSAISATVAVHTFSIFLKTAGRRYANLSYNTNGSSYVNGFIVDLQDGVITQTVGTFSVAPSVQNYGNGWFRVSYGAALDGGSFVYVNGAASSNSLTTAGRAIYIGSGSSSFYVWGADLQLGSFPTSYIPTTTTAVTRVVDSFNLNNIYSNGLISASGGTLFIEFKTKAFRDNGSQIVYIGDATNQLFIYGGSDDISFIVARFLGGAFSNVYLSSANTNNNIKLAFKWDGTFLNIFENGVKVVTNNSFTAVNLPNFIGQGTNDFKIQSTMLFPSPKSDADIIALTTL